MGKYNMDNTTITNGNRSKPLPKITGLDLSLKVQKQIKSEYRGIKFAKGHSSQTLEIKLLATMTKRRIQ